MNASADPFEQFKSRQRDMWKSFAPAAMFTTTVSGHLVEFAQIRPGERVLDVGAGTGVAAITAARAGAKTTGIDLTPALIEDARENARIAGVDVDWREGDAEALPFPDASFDVVLSQFGHIFAPRPEKAVAEMRRVLKTGGRVAFATWPPEQFIGRMFAFVGRNAPPPPPGAAPPAQWGSPHLVAERLASGFGPIFFARGELLSPALSLSHFREFMERSVGPIQTLMAGAAGDPARLAALRAEFEDLAAQHYSRNIVRQEYLLSRAAAI